MNIILLLAKESKTVLSEELKNCIASSLREKGHKLQIIELGVEDSSPCTGCFSCLLKHRGECISRDALNEIKKDAQSYDATIYLTEVIFGHFSSIIKNAIDKGTGSSNLQIFIGYGNDVDEEEESTFMDLIKKHRGTADIVHPGMDKRVEVFFSRRFEDNLKICRTLKDLL